MDNPPPIAPHSDLKGVDRDARAGEPNRDAAKGTAEDKQSAKEKSAGRPTQTETRQNA